MCPRALGDVVLDQRPDDRVVLQARDDGLDPLVEKVEACPIEVDGAVEEVLEVVEQFTWSPGRAGSRSRFCRI
jgi:hypothetical protein